MRKLSVVIALFLTSCVRHPGQQPAREEEDTSIRFPPLYDRLPIVVGEQDGLYDLDGEMLRAINVAANDFIHPKSKPRECWERPEAHRYRVTRRGDTIFVGISVDPAYCKGLMPMDYGVRYAIAADGQILRRLYAGEPEDLTSPPSPDAGEPGPEQDVDPSKLGTTNAPKDPQTMEMLERLGGRGTSSQQDGGSFQPSSPDAGTPVAPSQADGGTPPSP